MHNEFLFFFFFFFKASDALFDRGYDRKKGNHFMVEDSELDLDFGADLDDFGNLVYIDIDLAD